MNRISLASLFLFLCSAKSIDALSIAVTGATGRTGRLVVDSCIKSGYDVTAIVRNVEKAKELFGDSSSVTIRELDFADLVAGDKNGDDDNKKIKETFDGVDKMIWCASGLVDIDDGEDEEGEKKTIKESVDVIAMKHLLPSLSEQLNSNNKEGEKKEESNIIFLSSAGVTRPSWDDIKKEKLIGCSDIPIIRLNPGGILDKKCEAESILRASGIPYCVVRPTGLKFDDQEWPRGRTVFSQGDVAVGRMNANDLADLLVNVVNEPEACSKTFECFTLAGYAPPPTVSKVLGQLKTDDHINNNDNGKEVEIAYELMQQLLPGEKQDATVLEMGRTYEQIDSGAVQERERGAETTQREADVANGAVAVMSSSDSSTPATIQ